MLLYSTYSSSERFHIRRKNRRWVRLAPLLLDRNSRLAPPLSAIGDVTRAYTWQSTGDWRCHAPMLGDPSVIGDVTSLRLAPATIGDPAVSRAYIWKIAASLWPRLLPAFDGVTCLQLAIRGVPLGPGCCRRSADSRAHSLCSSFLRRNSRPRCTRVLIVVTGMSSTSDISCSDISCR